MSTGLLLIDIQRDYFPNGKMEVVNANATAENARLLLNLFRQDKNPIFHVQHISTREGATFFLPKTKGAEIDSRVSPISGEVVVTKNFPNSFRNTRLEESLTKSGIKSLVICGMMSHMCVDATVRASFDKGYICTVAHDACATINLTFNNVKVASESVHASYMASLGAVYAEVISTKKVIDEIKNL